MTPIYCFRRVLQLGAAIMLSGCTTQMASPQLHGVTPTWGYNGLETPVIVRGSHLYPSVEATSNEKVQLDESYRAWILTTPPTELNAVDLIDYQRISAVVPEGLEPGTYSLRLESPGGQRVTLPEAFQVTDTLANHIRATTDQLTWTVSDNAVVTIQVRDLAEAIVPLPLEITVRASGTAVGDGFRFTPNTLGNQASLSDTHGITGSLRADGQGYIAFTSDQAGDVSLRIEPTNPDSVIDPTNQAITFEAGRVIELELTLPSEDFSSAAGANFDVAVRLIDSLGNTVTGVPASVLLTETCPGGTMSTFMPVVDETTAVVAATAATGAGCDANQIMAVGVAEGATVTGMSQDFDVEANLLHHLEVSAAPAAVVAGSGTVNVAITAVDAWSNRVRSTSGPITLSDDLGEIGPENGNGTQDCGELNDGAGICTATLFRGGLERTVTAVAEAGATGVSNPFTVLPGPGDHLEVSLTTSSTEAGVPFDALIRLVDAFDNPIELSTTERDGIAFYDESGGVDCTYVTTDESDLRHTYSCICTAAMFDNVLYGVIDSLGAVGESGAFDVQPGPLAQVSIDLGIEGLGVELPAGDTLVADLQGYDAYGNLVEESASLTVSDTANGVSPTSITLTGGAASSALTFSSALIGNTVSLLSGDTLLGMSLPFNVIPGEPTGLTVSTAQPWAWTGEATAVTISPVDAWGNTVTDLSLPITLSSESGLGPDVSTTVRGEAPVLFTFEAAGLTDTLIASSATLDGRSTGLDVVSDCVDGPSVAMTTLGASYGSLCLGADDRVTASVEVSPSDLHVVNVQAGASHYRSATPEVSHILEGEGHTLFTALGIRDDGCAEAVTQMLYHGPVGPPVGEISVSLTDGTLIAGTSGGDERTRVNLAARTCTGDLADGGEVLVRAESGDLTSTADSTVTSTGAGLQVELDAAGEAAVRWTMADVEMGGTPTVYVGSRMLGAFGLNGAIVSGDDVAPQVIEASPMGLWDDIFDEVEIIFTEPMLDSISDELIMASVALTDPDGDPVPWASSNWSSDGTTLTLSLDSPRDAAPGVWTLEVLDELRDESGNRLDGDLDGAPGGTLLLSFGETPDTAPSVAGCSLSTNTFRPDGDDGDGLEADHVRLAIATDASATWWQLEVLDANGALILHRRSTPYGTESGTIDWDGRDQAGQTVANGLYRVVVNPTDPYWNLGNGCSVAVRVDNHLSPVNTP